MGRFNTSPEKRHFVRFVDKKRSFFFVDIFFLIPWYIGRLLKFTYSHKRHIIKVLSSASVIIGQLFVFCVTYALLIQTRLDLSALSFDLGQKTMAKPLEYKSLDDFITEQDVESWIEQNSSDNIYTQEWVIKPKKKKLKKQLCYYDDDSDEDIMYTYDNNDCYYEEYQEDDCDERPLY